MKKVNLTLKKQAQLIDSILFSCGLRKYAGSDTDVSKETVMSAMSGIVSALKSSNNKLNDLESELNSNNLFDSVTSLRIFKKIAKFFGFDVVSAYKDSVNKVISEIKSSGGISQSKIEDFVNSSVSSRAPTDPTDSSFKMIFAMFTKSSALSSSSVRMAKICLAQEFSHDDVEKYKTSEHIVVSVSTKIIQWMISYAVDSANYLLDSMGHGNTNSGAGDKKQEGIKVWNFNR